MKPVYQTRFGNREGNCLAACVASILELSIDEVPNFVEVPGEPWWYSVVDFLATFDLWPLVIDAKSWVDTGHSPLGYHIITGRSPRGEWDHAVVGHNGEIVHDPHPGGGGLASIDEYLIFASRMENR